MLRNAAILIFGLILAAPGGCLSARAQEGEASEPRLKAAFLYKFGNFIEWPTNAFNSPTAPMIIGVAGSGPFRSELERTVQNKAIDGHPLLVKEIKNISDLKNCHILFIGSSEKRLAELLKAVRGTSVLTVGETDGFIAAGGMINFLVEENKIRFEVNNTTAQQAGLKISSKLLMLAKQKVASRRDQYEKSFAEVSIRRK